MPPMFGKLPKEQFSVQGKLLPESEPGRPVKTTSYNPSPNFVENTDLSLDTSRCDISPVKVLKRVQVPNDLDTSSSKPVNSDPKTRPKTLHERIANYYAVRSRIFGSQGCLVSEKIRKLRNRFIAKKRMYKAIEATTLCSSDDPRPYATVSVFGEPILGLLDSGASISCLGADGVEILRRSKIDFANFTTQIKTADGKVQPVIGKVMAEITYKGETKNLLLFIAPSLQ